MSWGLDHPFYILLNLAVGGSFDGPPGRATTFPAQLFIDRVANYHPEDGKFRQWFHEEYASVKAHPKFRALTLPDVEDVHDGYFATSTKGVPKDTRFGRDTKDTEGAFERIMRNKEKLLSFEEPLRFS